MQAWRRVFVSTDWGIPLSQSLSCSKEEEHDAVVNAQRSFCDRVTERDEFVGRLSFVERFPQYLITYKNISTSKRRVSTAMLTGAVVVAW